MMVLVCCSASLPFKNTSISLNALPAHTACGLELDGAPIDKWVLPPQSSGSVINEGDCDALGTGGTSSTSVSGYLTSSSGHSSVC